MWTPAGYRKEVRHYDNGEPHFLTFSCYQRLPLLAKDRTRQWFLEALAAARDRHGFHLWAWVIMPEHVHLLIWPPLAKKRDGGMGSVSGILADIKRPVGQRAIRYLKENSPQFLKKLTVRNRNRTYHHFWQVGSGYDENIDDASVLHDVAEYIHDNPVRRELVERIELWPWSSAAEWLDPSFRSICPVDRTIPSKLEVPWSQHR